MSASSDRLGSLPAAARRSLLPASFAVFAFGSVALIPIMARQPKEVTAAIYAAYIAVMAVAAGVIFLKENRRRMAVGAALTCAAFSGLAVFYGYLAHGAQR